jgi:hypothetical protein
MPTMNAKKKNIVEEPAEVYEVTPNSEVTSEGLHPVLIQLIDKSIKNHDEGNVFTHKEAMKIYKERFRLKNGI